MFSGWRRLIKIFLRAYQAVLPTTSAEHRQLEPAWIPRFIDPDDEPLLQLAVESQVPLIVTHNTHNIRHLKPSENFGIEVLTPAKFLARMRESV